MNKMLLPLVLNIGKRKISIYTLLGAIGTLLGVLTVLFLSSYSVINHLYVLIMLGVSIFSFLALGFMVKVLIGTEDHTMLRSFIFIGVFQLLSAHLFSQPVLPMLDLFVIGYSIVISIGRFGCFAVGCCHGKPAKKGVCYSEKHVQIGFPKALANTALFPVQLLESLGLFLIYILCLYAFFGFRSGFPLIIFIYGYGILRFILEFYRGDKGRPYFLSFSEAQWTILILTSVFSLFFYLHTPHLFFVWMIGYFLLILVIMTIFLTNKRGN